MTDQPDTDTFYGWGALMPWLDLARRFDVTPWNGVEVRHDGADLRLGPQPSPCGDVQLRSESGVLSITINDIEQLCCDALGCYAVEVNEDTSLRWQITCEPGQPARSLTALVSPASVCIDGEYIAPASDSEQCYLLPAGASNIRIE